MLVRYLGWSEVDTKEKEKKHFAKHPGLWNFSWKKIKKKLVKLVKLPLQLPFKASEMAVFFVRFLRSNRPKPKRCEFLDENFAGISFFLVKSEHHSVQAQKNKWFFGLLRFHFLGACVSEVIHTLPKKGLRDIPNFPSLFWAKTHFSFVSFWKAATTSYNVSVLTEQDIEDLALNPTVRTQVTVTPSKIVCLGSFIFLWFFSRSRHRRKSWNGSVMSTVTAVIVRTTLKTSSIRR